MKCLILIVLVITSIYGFAQTDTLNLEKAINIALKNNYGIVIQSKNVDINQINNTWGKAGALPTVSFSGQASQRTNFYDDYDVTNKNISATVSLDWVVFRGFSARIQKEKLNEYEKMASTNLSLITENAIVDVSLAFYKVQLQAENLKLAEKIMNLSNDRYDREQRKKEIGSSKTYNLLQAQNAFLEDKSTYLTARANYNNSVRQLNFLMAVPVDQTYTFESKFIADTTSFDKKELTDKMMANNNNLKNQYINLEMARLNVKAAKSSYYPTVSVGASGGYTNSKSEYDSDLMTDSQNDGYNAGVSAGVSYSIYQGGQRKQALQVAQIEQEISSVETKQMEYELTNQLAQEFELYQIRKELLVLAEENLKAAELNLEISQQKFNSGAINSFNFRDIQQIYLNSSLNYLNSIYNVIQSYNTLMKLTGGIIEDMNK